MKQRSLYLIHYLLISMMSFSVYADKLSQQRVRFESAYEALQTKNFKKFRQLSASLQNYPLYYFLHYQYLKQRLKKVRSSKIRTFLRRYGNTYFGESLHRDWLKQLAKRGHWKTFMWEYTPQKSTELQCHYAQARLKTKQNRQATINDAKNLWLVGISQPEACTPVFNYLYRRGLIDDALVWERIRLAMNRGQLGLARYLAKRLDPLESVWVTHWQDMHKKPAQTLAQFEGPDIPVVRQIVLHGIRRLMRKQFELANDYWETFQRRYDFSVQQIGEMQRDLALAGINHPQALKWLTAVNKNYLNKKTSHARIKLALKTQDWHAVIDFIRQMSAKERNTLQWRYWFARALEQIGKSAQARRIYKMLAKERDYYGFLAAKRISAKYRMQHRSIIATKAKIAQLMKKPSIAGAYEFYQLSQQEPTWNLNARREWGYAIKHLSSDQQAIAAAMASRWGWHNQAITAAAKARHYDDLDVRFPLAFYNHLAAGAKHQEIDLAWVYGIVRQETAFWSEARSHAGALGLMQLMPRTGQFVAKKIGLKLKNTQDILDIDTNIKLGTAYLQQMLDKFDGNHMLATAAYNAGPRRAKRWAAENGCQPADIWVELIPFKETRTYVRRVLFYTRIFEYRLRQQPRPLRVALPDNCEMLIDNHINHIN